MTFRKFCKINIWYFLGIFGINVPMIVDLFNKKYGAAISIGTISILATIMLIALFFIGYHEVKKTYDSCKDVIEQNKHKNQMIIDECKDIKKLN